MPPLISLETSSLKHDGLTPVPSEGRMAELEFIATVGRDDSNVIQFSGPEILRRDEAEDRAEAAGQPRADMKGSCYSQLFENSPSAIVLLDTYDHVIDVNPAFTKIFQYGLEEIRHLPLTNFIVPKGRMRESIEMTLRTLRGEPIMQTLQRKRKDGSLVSLELTACPVRLPGSRIGIFEVYTDVSQRLRAEQRSAECAKLSGLGDLAGGAARAFNAVLGVLMAGTKQLMHGAQESGAGGRTIAEMNAALDSGVELVGRLLAFAGNAEVHPDAPNADARIRELAAMLQAIVEDGSATAAAAARETDTITGT